jgi:hypothetical protein
LVITGAANNGSGLIRLTVASTATFATGQVKTVSDVVGTSEANATWTITVVDATHIDLQGSTFVNGYASGGTIGGGVEEITLGGGLAMAANVLSATNNPLLLPNFISGLNISAAGASSSFGVATGVANDTTNANLMSLASVYTKTTASWVVGTGNGALDTGAIAVNTWYHVFLIKRTDTGVVDVLTSLSATTPTMPTNYTLSRRIGSLKTDGASQWIKFTQIGDEFLWDTPVQDINGTITTTASTLNLASVPTGVVVDALLNIGVSNASVGINMYLSPLSVSDQAASNTFSSLRTQVISILIVQGRFQLRTSTAAQFRARADAAATTFVATTIGFIDRRGKL